MRACVYPASAPCAWRACIDHHCYESRQCACLLYRLVASTAPRGPPLQSPASSSVMCPPTAVASAPHPRIVRDRTFFAMPLVRASSDAVCCRYWPHGDSGSSRMHACRFLPARVVCCAAGHTWRRASTFARSAASKCLERFACICTACVSWSVSSTCIALRANPPCCHPFRRNLRVNSHMTGLRGCVVCMRSSQATDAGACGRCSPLSVGSASRSQHVRPAQVDVLDGADEQRARAPDRDGSRVAIRVSRSTCHFCAGARR